MKINEVMKITGLTKKAIYYYENEGLIKPTKNDNNDYRIYTEQDVVTLKKINALRKLDVPVKDIGIILNDSLKMNEVMVKQLCTIKERIKYLNKSKNIIESLIKDCDNGNMNIRTDSLDKLNAYLDMDAKTCAGYMKRELQRIFPGNFGKAMSIFYGAYLDEPIDTEEKQQAWYNLVNLLDSIEEVEFPDNIKSILDRMYENPDKLTILEVGREELTEKIMNRLDKMSAEERQALIMRMNESIQEENNSQSRENFLKINQFFNENPNIIPTECGIYLRTLSKSYKKFCEYILYVQKTM